MGRFQPIRLVYRPAQVPPFVAPIMMPTMVAAVRPLPLPHLRAQQTANDHAALLLLTLLGCATGQGTEASIKVKLANEFHVNFLRGNVEATENLSD